MDLSKTKVNFWEQLLVTSICSLSVILKMYLKIHSGLFHALQRHHQQLHRELITQHNIQIHAHV